MKAYCVKCREKNVEMKNPELLEMKGKGDVIRKRVAGTCPKCGTKMNKFVAADFTM